MRDPAVTPGSVPSLPVPLPCPAWLRDDLSPAEWQDALLIDIAAGLDAAGQSLAALRLLASALSPRIRAAARITEEGAARLPAALDAALRHLETAASEHLDAAQDVPSPAGNKAALHAAQAALCLLQHLCPTLTRARLLAARTTALQAQLRHGERSADTLGFACTASADAALAALTRRLRLQRLLGLDRAPAAGAVDAPSPPGAASSTWRDPAPYRARGAALPSLHNGGAADGTV